MSSVAELGRRAKRASLALGRAPTDQKDAGLLAAADLLLQRSDEVLAAKVAELRAERDRRLRQLGNGDHGTSQEFERPAAT